MGVVNGTKKKNTSEFYFNFQNALMYVHVITQRSPVTSTKLLRAII